MTKRSSKSTTKKKPKRKKGKKTDEERNHENPDESPLETDEEGEVESDLESESEKSEEKRADSSAPNEQRNILKLDEPPSKKSELGRGTDECVPSKSEEMKYNSKRKISKEERKSVSSEPKKKKKNSKEIPNCHNDKEGCKTNQHSCDNKEQQQFSNNIEENSVSNELPKKKRKRTKKVPDASGASSSGASSSGASSSRVSSSGDPINTPTVNYKEGSKTYQHSSQNEEQQQFSNSSEEREKRSVKKQVFGSNETTSGNASYSFTNVFTAHTIRNDQEEKTDDTLLRRSLRSRTNVTNHPLNEEWFAERNNPNYANAAKKSNLGYEHTFRDSSSNSSKPKLLKESSSSNPCFVDISTEGKIVVRINFLVAVPSKLIDDSDMLVVICGHRDLGRWEQPLVALHQIRNAMESFGIYSAKLNVPEELLKYPLQYKYLVLNTNGIKFWEVLNRREYEENRVLSFKSLKGCTKHRHYQFDDIFIPQKGIGGKIMSYISSFFKNQDPFSHLPDVFEFYANKIMEANPNLKPYLIFCLYKSFFDASSHTHDRQKSWKKLEDLKIFEDTIKIYLARMKSVMVNDTAFNIQDQDRIKQFADVLLMLSGLVNCDIRMDALVVPICDILSLNGFCCSNILLKDALQSILEDHIELVCSGLKSLWEIIRRSRSIDIGEKWIHPLVLIHLLDERNDVLKDFERLDARHVKSVINNAEIVRKSLEMDQALQKMICFSMDQENFAFALKTGCFNKSFVMEAMINCITEKNTDYFTVRYCIFIYVWA